MAAIQVSRAAMKIIVTFLILVGGFTLSRLLSAIVIAIA